PMIVDQARLAADIIVPYVVLDRLEAPSRLSGRHVDRDDRAVVRIFLWRAPGRDIIVGDVAGGHIDQAQLLVARADRPAVGAAAHPDLPLGRIAVPIRMLHVPRPGELAGLRIEALDHAGRRAATLAVEHLVADDNDPAHD